MEISDLKERIIEEKKLEDILIALGMHSIKNKGSYYSCGMPTGDNKGSTVVYQNSLNVEAHTRNIKEKSGASDIISLTIFIKELYFTEAMKWICECCGFDYYSRDYKKPEILSFLDEVEGMKDFNDIDGDSILKPLDEKVLEYYGIYPMNKFYMDGISLKIQRDFGIGYDLMTHRITIPIRDELGTLVGVKGRSYEDDVENKYMYLYPCNKNRVLFGLNLAISDIRKAGIVYIGEAEKAPMQAKTTQINNVVSIGGHSLSRYQVNLLIHLGVDVCLAYDDMADYVTKVDSNGNKTLVRDLDFYKNEKAKFPEFVKVYAIIDKDRKILSEKESPFDNMHKWNELSTKYRKLIL